MTAKTSNENSGGTGGVSPAGASAEANSAVQAVQEIWEESYLQGVKVGFGKLEITRVQEDGQELLRLEQNSQLHLKRAGQESQQLMTFICWQTQDGRLVRFESEFTDGGVPQRAKGKVTSGMLRVQTHSLGNIQVAAHDWKDEWGGFFAQEDSLRSAPMKAGEKRTVIGLAPLLNAPTAIQLEALEEETARLPSGERKLLKVRSAVKLGDQEIETFLWTDERGEVHKTRMAGLGLETFRTSRSAATDTASIGNLDLLVSSVVKPKGDVEALATARRVVYRARLKEGKVEKAFADYLSQRVTLIDEHTADLTVIAVRPNEPAMADPDSRQPTDDDLTPGSYIQSNDEEVIRLASAVAPEEKDPWKQACALEQFVDRTITEKNFGSALATAAEVARTKAGDCTEHAVLLAALCRARKIPSRVAFGLVYVKNLGGFAYHMWTEVWIEDRWIPLDATLGQGGILCAHIKLGDSNLKGTESLAAMVSVAQVLNQLELEIREAK